MAKQSIFLGTVSNDGTGTNLRGGGSIINQNFDEIYTAIGDGTNLKGYITIEDTSSTVDTVNIGEKLQFIGANGITTTVGNNEVQIAIDGTVLTETSTDTLTNKNIALGTNIISGTLAEFNTALSDGSFCSLAGSETLTNKGIKYELRKPIFLNTRNNKRKSKTKETSRGVVRTTGITNGGESKTTRQNQTVRRSRRRERFRERFQELKNRFK